jgi:beta-lactamase class C
MASERLDPVVRSAVFDTHTAHFTAGVLRQDMLWEQYRFPVGLARLSVGNAPAMRIDVVRARTLHPPLAPEANVWFNNTSSIRGFSADAAFNPVRKFAVVRLSNKRYPISHGVTVQYLIMTALCHCTESNSGDRR